MSLSIMDRIEVYCIGNIINFKMEEKILKYNMGTLEWDNVGELSEDVVKDIQSEFSAVVIGYNKAMAKVARR